MSNLATLEKITFADNPDAALARYFELGYHVEPPGIFEPNLIDEINRAADTLPTAVAGTFGPVMQPHRIDATYLKAMKNPRLVAILERMAKGKISGIQSQMFFCRPGTRGYTRHQDNHYVEAPADAFVSAWTALEDVTRANGCLFIFPGTHLLATLPVEDVPSEADPGQDKNANRQQTVVPPGYESLDVPVKKGEVVFIHGQLVHASHQNVSNGFRRALLMTYVRQGVPFRPGNSAKRAEVDVYS